MVCTEHSPIGHSFVREDFAFYSVRFCVEMDGPLCDCRSGQEQQVSLRHAQPEVYRRSDHSVSSRVDH